MPCRRASYYCLYIGCKEKFFIEGFIKNENKFMLRVILRNPTERFMKEIPVTFQVIWQQESRIYSNSHDDCKDKCCTFHIAGKKNLSTACKLCRCIIVNTAITIVLAFLFPPAFFVFYILIQDKHTGIFSPDIHLIRV